MSARNIKIEVITLANPNPYLQINIETKETKLTITKIGDNLLIETTDPRDEQYYSGIEVDANDFIAALQSITGTEP